MNLTARKTDDNSENRDRDRVRENTVPFGRVGLVYTRSRRKSCEYNAGDVIK